MNFSDSMKKKLTLTNEEFDALLGWLSADRDEAGVLYEKIREGLIRYFRFRGCADPPLFADETINRVASKLPTPDPAQNFNTITYFYGFAAKVFFEYSRAAAQEVSLDSNNFYNEKTFQTTDAPTDTGSDCLENCLAQLTPEESELVLRYYEKDKSEKSAARRVIAAKMNLKMPALHIRVFRIKNILRDCIEKCLKNSL